MNGKEVHRAKERGERRREGRRGKRDREGEGRREGIVMWHIRKEGTGRIVGRNGEGDSGDEDKRIEE